MMKEMSYNVLMIGPPGLAKTIRRCLLMVVALAFPVEAAVLAFLRICRCPAPLRGDYHGLAHRAGAAPRGNNDDS